MKRPLLPVFALVAAAVPAFAQSNGDSGIDVMLAAIEDLRALGRTGVFPNGINGCALETTACNVGSKEISWQQAMDPDHPFIAFLLAREKDGRFEQISDRSYVKHGFFALSSEFCDDCSPTDGTMLGLGCSDTYSVGNNGDSFWLGPPDEINPWLGEWDPICSHFDRGEPALAPPNDCNGVRSLSGAQVNALGPVAHRIRVKDADFAVPGASFWFQGMYVIETELERSRSDNSASRGFTPVWNGSMWNLNETGVLQHGSILQRWSGATIDSRTNGPDDGRVYAAVKVTGPVNGLYRYEYALHNRDNHRGIGAFRIPVCSGARVLGLGFGDIDDVSGNDWTASVAAGEIAFTSGGANALEWNTIFNFWFDSDAAPAPAALALDQAAPGPGLPSLAVTLSAPRELFNVHLGPGCSLGTPPTLFATGTPPRATLGNATFALRSTNNQPGQPSFLRYSVVTGSFVQLGCVRYLGPGPGHAYAAGSAFADGTGTVVFNTPIPNDISLEGLDLSLQTFSRKPGNGAFRSSFDLSDGLLVRVGNSLSSCP